MKAVAFKPKAVIRSGKKAVELCTWEAKHIKRKVGEPALIRDRMQDLLNVHQVHLPKSPLFQEDGKSILPAKDGYEDVL